MSSDRLLYGRPTVHELKLRQRDFDQALADLGRAVRFLEVAVALETLAIVVAVVALVVRLS